MATAESQSLLTAEQFAALPDDGRITELVRGRIIEMPPPGFLHGRLCFVVTQIVGKYVTEHDLGYVVCNDSGVVTERNPDSVRGADVAFYSYARIPKGHSPDPYPDVAPDVVFEIRSPSVRWAKVMAKATEYLNAGVNVVCVLDPATRRIVVERIDGPPETLGGNTDLHLPEIDDGFRVPVDRFFE